MAEDETADRTIYKVVINHEEQYSIWAADRANPAEEGLPKGAAIFDRPKALRKETRRIITVG